jgi:hypothetical protein
LSIVNRTGPAAPLPLVSPDAIRAIFSSQPSMTTQALKERLEHDGFDVVVGVAIVHRRP